jgi:hypothetical protein
MVLFPSGSISGTINNSVYINCCGSNIDLNQQSYIDINMSSEIKESK